MIKKIIRIAFIGSILTLATKGHAVKEPRVDVMKSLHRLQKVKNCLDDADFEVLCCKNMLQDLMSTVTSFPKFVEFGSEEMVRESLDKVDKVRRGILTYRVRIDQEEDYLHSLLKATQKHHHHHRHKETAEGTNQVPKEMAEKASKTVAEGEGSKTPSESKPSPEGITSSSGTSGTSPENVKESSSGTTNASPQSPLDLVTLQKKPEVPDVSLEPKVEEKLAEKAIIVSSPKKSPQPLPEETNGQ